MSKLFLLVIPLLMLSCKNESNPFLELNITSRNKNSFVELKGFYLTNLTNSSKSYLFINVKCVSTNKFVFTNLNVGTYIGVIHIDNGARYYIDLGTISVQKGENKIQQEINLSTLKL